MSNEPGAAHSDRNSDVSDTRIFGGPLGQVLSAIETHKIGRLVSIINKDTMIDTPTMLEDDQHLKLAMNDISEPRDGLVLPSERHVQRLIDFIDDWDLEQSMLVHCWAGVSRSTAGVFISLCRLNEGVSENEIAEALREASPTATPNAKLVGLADDIMGRDGRMADAVQMIGQGEMAFEGAVFSMPVRFK